MSTPTLWYYHKEDRGFGPVEEGDIAGLFARNEVAADTLVWRDGLSNWTEARSTELSGFLFQVPPLPLPVPIIPLSRQKHGKLFWAALHPRGDIQLSYLRRSVICGSSTKCRWRTYSSRQNVYRYERTAAAAATADQSDS